MYESVLSNQGLTHLLGNTPISKVTCLMNNVLVMALPVDRL